MMTPDMQWRERAIRALRRYLEREHFPRLMVVVLALTGIAGFLASFEMLRRGMDAMWIRYPLAAAGLLIQTLYPT